MTSTTSAARVSASIASRLERELRYSREPQRPQQATVLPCNGARRYTESQNSQMIRFAVDMGRRVFLTWLNDTTAKEPRCAV